MEAYITGMGCISPQPGFKLRSFPELSPAVTNRLQAIEPSYKDFLDPMLARRMGRTIKMGIAAASACLEDAGVTEPSAIITGTALGCLESTEKFLGQMIENNEQFLTPTQFIQSTHNTVTAQIALQLQCKAYNHTYVHRGFSFESALIDALMHIREGSDNILVGGHEEITDNNFFVYSRLGKWKNTLDRPLHLSNTKGTVCGESAVFFNLRPQPDNNTRAKIAGVTTFYNPENPVEAEQRISAFLTRHNIVPDLILYGINGDAEHDGIYHHLKNGLLSQSAAGYFKHLCGEHETASSFALWTAATALYNGSIPHECLIDPHPRDLRSVLIMNQYDSVDYSLILVTKA